MYGITVSAKAPYNFSVAPYRLPASEWGKDEEGGGASWNLYGTSCGRMVAKRSQQFGFKVLGRIRDCCMPIHPTN